MTKITRTVVATTETGEPLYHDVLEGDMMYEGRLRRSKLTHPYSYDPITVFDSGKKATEAAYSDRMMGWDADKYERAYRTHIGNLGFARATPQIIEAFLRDYYDNPTLELVGIQEHCNWSTGYPVWYFAWIK